MDMPFASVCQFYLARAKSYTPIISLPIRHVNRLSGPRTACVIYLLAGTVEHHLARAKCWCTSAKPFLARLAEAMASARAGPEYRGGQARHLFMYGDSSRNSGGGHLQARTGRVCLLSPHLPVTDADLTRTAGSRQLGYHCRSPLAV